MHVYNDRVSDFDVVHWVPFKNATWSTLTLTGLEKEERNTSCCALLGFWSPKAALMWEDDWSTGGLGWGWHGWNESMERQMMSAHFLRSSQGWQLIWITKTGGYKLHATLCCHTVMCNIKENLRIKFHNSLSGNPSLVKKFSKRFCYKICFIMDIL